MTSYMTVNGCKTVIKKDTAIGEHYPEYKKTPLTDLHVHTRPAPEKFGLVVLRSAIPISQREIRSNKSARTVIPESKNKNQELQRAKKSLTLFSYFSHITMG